MRNWCGNFTEFLLRNIQNNGGLENPAIQTEDETIVYRELFYNINRAGNVLKDKGIKAGDRLLLVMNDSPRLVYGFLGAIRIGAIPAILNTLLPPSEYPDYAADSQARLCLVDDELMHKVESLQGEMEIMATVKFAAALERSSLNLDFHVCAGEQPAFWQYSSGSTGKPKAVIHSHRGPIEVANRFAREILQMDSTDRCFSTSRMFFGYGLGNSLLFPFLAGAVSILTTENITPVNVCRIITKFHPSLFFSIPSFYVQLLVQLPESETEMSSVRLSISAGEALPASTYKDWKATTGIDLLDGIGSTEALHIFISNQQGKVRPGSCGQPLPDVDVKLIDNNGEAVRQDEPGRLMVRFPGLALGYWQRPELNAETFINGWLDTRDILRMDEEGYFWHMGRADDMFKVKGMWVSPVEVENCILNHSSVTDCAVLGQPNEQGITEVNVYMVMDPANDQEKFAEYIRTCLEQKLPRYKLPTRFHYVDIIPRTATGKKKRFELNTTMANCA